MVEGPKSDAIHNGLEGALGKSTPLGPAAARSKGVGAAASKAAAGCTDTIHAGMMGTAVMQRSPDLAESPEERTERLHMGKMVEG